MKKNTKKALLNVTGVVTGILAVVESTAVDNYMKGKLDKPNSTKGKALRGLAISAVAIPSYIAMCAYFNKADEYDDLYDRQESEVKCTEEKDNSEEGDTDDEE